MLNIHTLRSMFLFWVTVNLPEMNNKYGINYDTKMTITLVILTLWSWETPYFVRNFKLFPMEIKLTGYEHFEIFMILPNYGLRSAGGLRRVSGNCKGASRATSRGLPVWKPAASAEASPSQLNLHACTQYALSVYSSARRTASCVYAEQRINHLIAIILRASCGLVLSDLIIFVVSFDLKNRSGYK